MLETGKPLEVEMAMPPGFVEAVKKAVGEAVGEGFEARVDGRRTFNGDRFRDHNMSKSHRRRAARSATTLLLSRSFQPLPVYTASTRAAPARVVSDVPVARGREADRRPRTGGGDSGTGDALLPDLRLAGLSDVLGDARSLHRARRKSRRSGPKTKPQAAIFRARSAPGNGSTGSPAFEKMPMSIARWTTAARAELQRRRARAQILLAERVHVACRRWRGWRAGRLAIVPVEQPGDDLPFRGVVQQGSSRRACRECCTRH